MKKTIIQKALVVACLSALIGSPASAYSVPGDKFDEPGKLRIREGEYTVIEALELLLKLTNQRLYLIDQADLTASTGSMVGFPQDLLRSLLRKNSYGAIVAGDADSALVLIPGAPSVAAGAEDNGALKSVPEQKSAMMDKGVGKKGAAYQHKKADVTISTVNNRAVVLSASAAEPRTSPESTVAQDESVSLHNIETADSDDLAAEIEVEVETAIKRDELKDQLWKKIEVLREYIESGAAKKWYDRWAKIKDPKYIYSPWKELATLKEKYEQLL